MPKISVIIVTNRKGGAESAMVQVAKQTFKDWEVVVADDSTIPPFYDVAFNPRQKKEGDVWNLNKAYNDCLKKAKGELIVFLQDFIEIPANGLQRFWDIYRLYPNDLVTGCGHKYKDGKLVETDERCFGTYQLVESDWSYYELNWSSCPSKIAPKFEEDMDKFYGGENQIFALKAKLEHGSEVWLDRTNVCKGLVHEDRPENWESCHINKNNRHNKKIKELYERYHIT